jgi:ribose-phosphate pyrophosphokinase
VVRHRPLEPTFAGSTPAIPATIIIQLFKMDDFKISSGRSNIQLSNKVAESLGIQLSEVTIRNFTDGEIWVKFEENIRGVDLFIIQSTQPPSDNLMELLILIDAAKRASARRVTAVIPYFGYARQDRKDQPRVSITAKLVANLLTRAGADRIISIDLHSGQIQGYFDIPLDHLYASSVLISQIKKMNFSPLAVVSPDAGGIKTARSYAKKLGGDLVVADKRRPSHNVAEIMHIIGEVDGKNVCIVDDLIDTGNTFLQSIKAMKEAGAQRIIGLCVHPVFSANCFERIIDEVNLEKMFVTDTIPMKLTHEKIQVVSVAELLGEAIIRTHDNRSISSLFEIER